MAITSALVLFAVVWAMTFFIVLPLKMQSQSDAGEAVPGTHASAPSSQLNLRRKALVTTLIALPIWAVLTAVILSGWIGIDDLDFLRESREGFTNEG